MYGLQLLGVPPEQGLFCHLPDFLLQVWPQPAVDLPGFGALQPFSPWALDTDGLLSPTGAAALQDLSTHSPVLLLQV